MRETIMVLVGTSSACPGSFQCCYPALKYIVSENENKWSNDRPWRSRVEFPLVLCLYILQLLLRSNSLWDTHVDEPTRVVAIVVIIMSHHFAIDVIIPEVPGGNCSSSSVHEPWLQQRLNDHSSLLDQNTSTSDNKADNGK